MIGDSSCGVELAFAGEASRQAAAGACVKLDHAALSVAAGEACRSCSAANLVREVRLRRAAGSSQEADDGEGAERKRGDQEASARPTCAIAGTRRRRSLRPSWTNRSRSRNNVPVLADASYHIPHAPNRTAQEAPLAQRLAVLPNFSGAPQPPIKSSRVCPRTCEASELARQMVNKFNHRFQGQG